MKAGRELDALVAEKVFGQKLFRGAVVYGNWSPQDDGYDGYVCDVPRYSTDIAAAWKVVEQLETGTDDDLPMLIHLFQDCDRWKCCVHLQYDHILMATAWEDTAPLAICIAALKAKGVDV